MTCWLIILALHITTLLITVEETSLVTVNDLASLPALLALQVFHLLPLPIDMI